MPRCSSLPQGEIVEQLASDPIRRAFDEASGQGQTQTLLWDLTESIRAAASDGRVKAILLQLDNMDSAGQPTLEEVAAALRAFRATGKKVVAHGTSFHARPSTTSRRRPTRSISTRWRSAHRGL